MVLSVYRTTCVSVGHLRAAFAPSSRQTKKAGSHSKSDCPPCCRGRRPRRHAPALYHRAAKPALLPPPPQRGRWPQAGGSVPSYRILSLILLTCRFTVRSQQFISAAISAFLRPCRRKSSTSRSSSVRLNTSSSYSARFMQKSNFIQHLNRGSSTACLSLSDRPGAVRWSNPFRSTAP